MNVYRVQYYLITGLTTERMRGQEFQQRHGLEKMAYVVADSSEAAGSFISNNNDCEITGVQVHLGAVQIATTPEPPAEKEGE